MLSYFDLHGRCSLGRLAAAAALLCSGAAAQTGLGLAPMRVDLNLAPGAVHSGVLTVANNGGGTVRAVGEALDFFLDETATPQFGPDYPREAGFSCRTWLVANPMDLELNAATQMPVRFTVRVPPTATPRSYHCAIGFTTQPTAREATAMGLRTAVQVVAAIYVVVGKPALEGTVRDIKLEYVPDPKTPGWRAVVTINNSGLMHFRPEGTLEVLDGNGTVVESAPFVPMPVLPMRDQNFPIPLRLERGEGKYTLRARVDLGGDEIQEATVTLVAAKPKP